MFFLSIVRLSAEMIRRCRGPLRRMSTLPGLWQGTYDAKDRAELIRAYDKWAGSYDEDSIGTFGYAAPRRAAEALARNGLPKSATVLDGGAGTGLVGQFLAQDHGFTRITALDISESMLEVARAKTGVYERCVLGDLEDMRCFDDGSFDAAVCVGCAPSTLH